MGPNRAFARVPPPERRNWWGDPFFQLPKLEALTWKVPYRVLPAGQGAAGAR